jgi:hypothetical protein
MLLILALFANGPSSCRKVYPGGLNSGGMCVIKDHFPKREVMLRNTHLILGRSDTNVWLGTKFFAFMIRKFITAFTKPHSLKIYRGSTI